ncbi:MAG TPA: FHA domain-containing protein [Polyangiaceae bacterium]
MTNKGSGATQHLSRHEVVGRSSTATFRIDEVRVSARHASIRWDGARWELKDLHSSNGTFVRGERILPGACVTVAQGDEIAFGSLQTAYFFDDVSPPTTDAMLVPRTGAAALRLEGGICTLPSAEAPEVTLYRDAAGVWWRESDDLPAAVPLAEGEQVVVRGERFVFTTGVLGDETGATEAGARPLFAKDLTLEFAVSDDEEYVQLTVAGSGRTISLGARSAFYLLLTLARVRLGHTLPKNERSEDGWVFVTTLEQMLGATREQINVDVCRVRQALREHGVSDPAAIVERRRNLLRIGTSSIVLRRL